MNRCHDVMHLHMAAVQSLADAEDRADHLRAGAVAMAAVGEVALALDILPRIDDAVYRGWGWAEVAVSLALARHPAAPSVVRVAGDRVADTIAIDDDFRSVCTGQLAIAAALVGDRASAGRWTDDTMARLPPMPGREERAEAAAMIVEAAALGDFPQAFMACRDAAERAIDDEFRDPDGHYSTAQRCATFLAAALYHIGRRAEARALTQSVAQQVVAAAREAGAPLSAAGSLMDLAIDVADMGDVPLACHVAGLARGLRTHPDAWHAPNSIPMATACLMPSSSTPAHWRLPGSATRTGPSHRWLSPWTPSIENEQHARASHAMTNGGTSGGACGNPKCFF